MMKFPINALIRLATAGCLMAPLPLLAKTAPEIMKAVDDNYRSGFTTAIVKVQLSTCKYVLDNTAINCKEKPRVTILEVGEKRFGHQNRDSRALAFVFQPITDKGVGLLTYEYANVDRENDVLLYLPALEKVRRVVSGGDGNEDGGSFFGTEFFVDDTLLKKVEEWDFTMVGEDTQDNRPAWVIECVPKPRRAKKTQYGKTNIWIDKERYVVLREDIYNKAGKLYRQRLNKDFNFIDNRVWISKRQMMNNFATNRITVVQNISATYNKEVPDELMTERSLTDPSFKERILATLRTYYTK
ncbi:MAG TPA: outer membrane lipoprotein-sorting protein [Paucimonas sp.]|nr:outer membrane lipoprotein-sorting protein [Paucimonas sp.]